MELADLTTRIVRLDWLEWDAGARRGWLTEKLGTWPSDYLLKSEPDAKATEEASLLFIRLPEGPRLRVDNITILAGANEFPPCSTCQQTQPENSSVSFSRLMESRDSPRYSGFYDRRYTDSVTNRAR